MKSILDKSFRYIPAALTNIRVSINKEKRRLAEEKARAEANAKEVREVVRELKRKIK